MILILIILAMLWFAAGTVIAGFLGGCERLDAMHRRPHGAS
ncbi:hypothetical protein [Angustibacter luteus]|uniref:MetS family NSS transporter small subunit n=1 Tax=Angustibacter luteus TaxID=658456 RepID=A0ABW1JGZ6_9ACTN